ncbi:hypothetical protein ACOSQ4_014405 [Xanthoceras sorbifolium]
MQVSKAGLRCGSRCSLLLHFFSAELMYASASFSRPSLRSTLWLLCSFFTREQATTVLAQSRCMLFWPSSFAIAHATADFHLWLPCILSYSSLSTCKLYGGQALVPCSSHACKIAWFCLVLSYIRVNSRESPKSCTIL